MDIKKLLGKRIQEIRKFKKLTQEQVAEIIEMEPASLSNIENGKYYPTAENLEKILSALETKPSELFAFEHLAPKEELLSEMNLSMQDNEKLTRLMYKFFQLVK